MSCEDCDCGCPDSSDNYGGGDLNAEFEGFRAGMYQAMQMLGAPQGVLIPMAGSTTRSECILRFTAWMEA